LIWKLINGDRTLCLVEASKLEVDQLRLSFTKTIPTARFDPRVRAGHWDGKISYFRSDRYLPSGLWGELVEMAESFDFSLEIEDIERLFDHSIDEQEFKSWVESKWKDAELKPRDYQIQSAYKILRTRNCLSELATSAGKSLIIYMVLGYLLERGDSKRVLMIVPNTDLVIQASEDFEQYNSESVRVDLNIQQIYGGSKLKESSNVVIGTYQSLINKTEAYFVHFDTVVVDETHRAKGYSIRSILEKCINSTRRFGLSGTIPKVGTLDRLTIMSYTGPVVSTVKADFLSKKGYISKCKVIVVEMDYAAKEVKEAFETIYDSGPDQRKTLFNLEKNYAIESKGRLSFITDFILKVEVEYRRRGMELLSPQRCLDLSPGDSWFSGRVFGIERTESGKQVYLVGLMTFQGYLAAKTGIMVAVPSYYFDTRNFTGINYGHNFVGKNVEFILAEKYMAKYQDNKYIGNTPLVLRGKVWDAEPVTAPNKETHPA
jgi:hypothetical protein